MQMVLLLFLSCPFIHSSYVSETSNAPNILENLAKMKSVKERIMAGYDKYSRPQTESREGTEIYFDLRPRQIIDVDETKGLFVLDSLLCMRWKDLRLRWRVKEYHGDLEFSQDELWWPHFSVVNSYSFYFNPQSNHLLSCNSEGTVSWCPSILTQTSCSSLLETTYPYGEVKCNVTFGSHNDNSFLMSYHRAVDLRYFVNAHPRWELFEDHVQVTPGYRNDEDNHNYHTPSKLVYSFLMRRRPVPEIEATRVPCILVILLTLAVFWMPPKSPMKVLVLGFQFLVLTVLNVYLAWSTKSPAGVLLATSFLQSTMCIVVATFLLQILVIFNLCNFSDPACLPPSAKKFMWDPFRKFTFKQDNNHVFAEIPSKEDSSITFDSPTPRNNWIFLAVVLDKVFFVVMVIAIFVIQGPPEIGPGPGPGPEGPSSVLSCGNKTKTEALN